MPQSVYRVVTDKGTYNVTVDEGAAPPAAPAAQPKRGYMDTLTDMSDPKMLREREQGEAQAARDLGQGMKSAVPFVGGETPDSAMGYVGRGTGEAALLAVPAEKAVTFAGKVIPSSARAGANFSRVMSKAATVPVGVEAPGQVALRIQTLADRGNGAMPRPVRQFLLRITDPNKAPMEYEELRDFASGVSKLSSREMAGLNGSVINEIHKLRIALNEAAGKAAAQVGKEAEYWSAMKEYARAATLKGIKNDVVAGAKRALPYAVGGGATGAGYWTARKLSDLIGGE